MPGNIGDVHLDNKSFPCRTVCKVADLFGKVQEVQSPLFVTPPTLLPMTTNLGEMSGEDRPGNPILSVCRTYPLRIEAILDDII
jgi:hypothetical protein